MHGLALTGTAGAKHRCQWQVLQRLNRKTHLAAALSTFPCRLDEACSCTRPENEAAGEPDSVASVVSMAHVKLREAFLEVVGELLHASLKPMPQALHLEMWCTNLLLRPQCLSRDLHSEQHCNLPSKNPPRQSRPT